MKATAILLSRPQLPPRSCLVAHLSDLAALMKPRVMVLAVFTALVGLMSAPSHPAPLLASVTMLAIAAGAGAAGVLNMWYDADIDAVMTRTAMRPIPRGTISRFEALVFGLVLGGFAVVVLALATNLTAAALLAGTILFYVVVYTAWLKRATRQNIVIASLWASLCSPSPRWGYIWCSSCTSLPGRKAPTTSSRSRLACSSSSWWSLAPYGSRPI
jgi:heme O synthase-like polyprenyltransferase